MNTNNTNPNSGLKFLGAVLLGTVIGASLALLLAPSNGAETRRRLADGAKDLGDELKHKFGQQADTETGLDDPELSNPV